MITLLQLPATPVHLQGSEKTGFLGKIRLVKCANTIRNCCGAGYLMVFLAIHPITINAQNNSIQWSVFSSGFGFAQSLEANITALTGHSLMKSQSDVGIIISGFFSNTAARVITSDREVTTSLPVRFELFQNYPNPFNPSTNITIAVATHGPVTLRVFDVLGREVTVLVNRELPAGYHNLNWNAAGYPTGIYLYALEIAGTRSVKKMILLK
jgi:hypothetical protein